MAWGVFQTEVDECDRTIESLHEQNKKLLDDGSALGPALAAAALLKRSPAVACVRLCPQISSCGSRLREAAKQREALKRSRSSEATRRTLLGRQELGDSKRRNAELEKAWPMAKRAEQIFSPLEEGQERR